MAQRFEKVVQEDLNIGTDTVWVTAPGSGKLLSTQIGLHSVARGQQQYQAAWTPGAIAAGLSASTTLTVPDAATGDFVMASHDKILTNDLRISGNVSATGTAQVVIHNPTASSVTVAAGTVSVLVFQSIGTSTDPAGANITGTVTYDEFPYGAAPGPVWPSVAVSLDLDGVPWAGGTETTDANGVYTFTGVPAATLATVTVGPAIPPGEVQQFNDSAASAHDGINETTIDLYATTGGA